MSFADDLTTMLGSPFSTSCTAGGTTANGILSQPSEVVLDGMVLFSDYTLQAKASDFGTLVANDAISVGGVAYTVRETRFSTDGLLVTIAIQKT